MRFKIILLLTFACLLPISLLAFSLRPGMRPPGLLGMNFYVATNGNDSWSGGIAEPNAARTDGPLASLAAARDALRQPERPTNLPVSVIVRGGTYRLEKPFVLEPQDSRVTYVAAKDERPIISGGRMLTDFRQNGKFWECVIPEVKTGQWYFRQLFVNGQRRQRARSPNEGYFRIAGLPPATKDAKGKDVPARTGFLFKPGDIQSYERLSDVNLILMHSWETSIHPLKTSRANGI